MKIEVNTRVVKSSAGTEVFITRDADPYINQVIHLPADAEIKDGDTVEFTQAKPRSLSEEEAKKRASELPGQIAPAGAPVK